MVSLPANPLQRVIASVLLAMTIMAVSGTAAQAACRQALAIGLDISGSVDDREYRLQLDGLAGALSEPEVQRAFLAMPEANVRLLVFEWGGPASQRILLPWTDVTVAGDLQQITAVLRGTARQSMELSTALGTAMLFGGQNLIGQNDCWRLTMDLSGDGQSNSGPQPQDAGLADILNDVTINALVIGADAPPFSDISQSEIAELSAYFRANVIRGPDAFVQTAIEFAAFQDAMAQKLLKELQTRAVGALPAADP